MTIVQFSVTAIFYISEFNIDTEKCKKLKAIHNIYSIERCQNSIERRVARKLKTQVFYTPFTKLQLTNSFELKLSVIKIYFYSQNDWPTL